MSGFLSDYLLKYACDGVTRAKQSEQSDVEDEYLYVQRIMDASRVGRHVFQAPELVNEFVGCLDYAKREKYKSRSGAYHMS